MNHQNEPAQLRFLEETANQLRQNGFTVEPIEDHHLPVSIEKGRLCRISGKGSVLYRQENVDNIRAQDALQTVIDTVKMTSEYMAILETAPQLKASGLDGDYRILADFGGTVLAGTPSKHGVQFVTWNWDYGHTGVSHGHYFMENYDGAKQDFAIRAGLISKQQIFNQEQLIEIYRCCSDTLDAGFDLTAEQEKCIRGVQEQIAIAAPDALDRIREQEQHPMEPYNQEPIM